MTGGGFAQYPTGSDDPLTRDPLVPSRHRGKGSRGQAPLLIQGGGVRGDAPFLPRRSIPRAPFSHQAWQDTATLRAAIHALPFNAELAAGTLPPEKFRFYIVQDTLYLDQYARALALAAARGPDMPTLRAFSHHALGAVEVEQALHARILAEFGVDPAALATAEPSPDGLGYTSFLMATAYHEPWEVLVAALLPCFWLYFDVGTAIAEHAAPDNPYRAWIDTYAAEGFGEAVRAVIAATDQAAAGTTPAIRARMATAFRRSCQYEWLFWDGAWAMRSWPA